MARRIWSRTSAVIERIKTALMKLPWIRSIKKPQCFGFDEKPVCRQTISTPADHERCPQWFLIRGIPIHQCFQQHGQRMYSVGRRNRYCICGLHIRQSGIL